ncbi:MAG: hypothetical protein M3478_09100 [Planctomycetota bacterium]|nr:hypothetical protein [Planctomycetota bacterium]
MRIITTLILCALTTGCATSYVAPGRGAQMAMFGATPEAQAAGTDTHIQKELDRKPLAAFPASIAVARVQAAGYASRTAAGWGTGQYSVVTTRDIESDADTERLGKLPMVRGVASLNRLVLPQSLQSDYELRHAAAKMHADVLLIYTLDTTFQDLDRTTPLSIVTLGAASTKRKRILCTASAVLLDTRSGYVYGLAEATKQHEELQNAWKTESEVDARRREVERKAFIALMGDVEKAWTGIVREHGSTARAGLRYETAQ